MKQNQLKKMGALEVNHIEGSNHDSAVVLLHGFGANAFDLAGLKQWAGPLSDSHWYLPQAPIALPMGYFDGRAWFPIQFAEMEQRRLAGEEVKFSELTPPELITSSEKVQALLDLIAQKHSQIHLGGFSQGGMLAIDSALHWPQNLASLFLLSTNPLAAHRWQKAIEEKKKAHSQLAPVIFQSHGALDPVLPQQQARELFENLKTMAENKRFISFQGGHEIPPRVWEELGILLREKK